MAKETKSSSVKIQPLADRVLVRRIDADEKKSIGGIIIPDTAQKEKSKMGIIVAVGSGRVSDEGKVVPMSLIVGAKVIFNSGWDNEVSMDDDEEYFLVKESDVLAVVK